MSLVEQRERECLHHQRRHQVLEHAPAPREQRSGSSGGSEGSAQPEPVIDRHVVLGNRYEGGESRFRSEQIVVRVVYRVAADVITDREQLPLGVVQEAEIHLHGVGVRALRYRPQPLRIEIRARRILHHLVAGLLERDQMSGKVPAIHRRDVRRLEHPQLVQIVPVEEMSVKTPHPLQRPEHLLHAVDHVRPRDEAEVDRADGREKLESDVGGRCAERQNRLGVLLEVVRREPVRLFGHEFLEVHPVQLCIPERCLSLRFGEMQLTENRWAAQRERNARARQPGQHERESPHDEQEPLIRGRDSANSDVHTYQRSQNQTERCNRQHFSPRLELRADTHGPLDL